MSYNTIIPDQYQEQLLAIRDQTLKDSWLVGDITNTIIHSSTYPYEEVYKAVGAFVGKAARSIREHSYISSQFSGEIRQRFSILSYDHFRTCLKFGDKKIDALQWCVDQGDILGRPATVDSMELHFMRPDDAFQENYREAPYWYQNDNMKAEFTSVTIDNKILQSLNGIYNTVKGKLSSKTESAYADFVNGLKEDLKL